MVITHPGHRTGRQLSFRVQRASVNPGTYAPHCVATVAIGRSIALKIQRPIPHNQESQCLASGRTTGPPEHLVRLPAEIAFRETAVRSLPQRKGHGNTKHPENPRCPSPKVAFVGTKKGRWTMIGL